LPTDQVDPAKTTVPLFEFVHRDGKKRAYSVDSSWTMPDYQRAPQPICRVWRKPSTAWDALVGKPGD
jgi:hypothetical protein